MRWAWAVPVCVIALVAACDDVPPTYGAVYVVRRTPERGNDGGISAALTSRPQPLVAPDGQCGFTAPAGRGVNAGTLYVDVGDQHFELEYEDDDRDYPSVPLDLSPPEPGMAIRASADGAETRGFEGGTEFPDHLTGVTMPDTGEAVSLADDVRVAWAPSTSEPPEGSERRVGLSLSTGSVAIVCSADDSQGEITIPRTLLAEIYPGDHLLLLTRSNRARLGGEEPVLLALSFWNARPQFVDGSVAGAER